MTDQTSAISSIIAKELKVQTKQVEAAINLLDDGATVPFIARYRKEATQGLDDIQLRQLFERLDYLQELEDRRQVILSSIAEQEKLTDELKTAILEAQTKTRLEDLYLPYRPKRRTKASMAIEAGLEPLALSLLQDPTQEPDKLAEGYINAEFNIENSTQALEGAKQILMEKFAEDANLISQLRQHLWNHGILTSKKVKSADASAKKYADYFEYAEQIKSIPSHRALALFRGRREGCLQIALTLPEEPEYGSLQIQKHFDIANQNRKADQWLIEAADAAWKIKLFTKLELELLTQVRERADEEAIKVFASNLRDLLLAAPAGDKVTIGLDPGIRTGVKLVVIDETGKLLDFATLYPFAPQNQWHDAVATLAKMVSKYRVDLISIGNGTASRETERLVAEMLKMYADLNVKKLIVSEAGASVYSASELASKEFPELDVSLRGAVSIARRLQDPLAELVKIEPKSIGVGQYQHDVNQNKLARSLEAVVEDCVNAVGVDVNTASPALLTRVSGFNETLANNLVKYRDEHGAFSNREALKNIARMGDKTFEQSAGFLRIMNGDNPLDASAVHPETYPLVQQILQSQKLEMKQIIGNQDILQAVNADSFVTDEFGKPTILDVLKELEKPGRDPRPEFKTATFKEGVETIEHLEKDMLLEGVVSNVTNFGAFVDIGVHQDGLVHISALTNRFVSDPRTVVKAGQIVQVKVLEVDKERKRISLTMRLDEASQADKTKPHKTKKSTLKTQNKTNKNVNPKSSGKPAKKAQKPLLNTAMADALSKLKRENS